MIIRVPKGKRGPAYFQMLTEIVERRDLSLKAKGMMGYFMSRPDNWNVNVEDLIRRSTDGKHSVYSGLYELELAGYAERIEMRDSRTKRVMGYDYIIREKPQPGFQYTGILRTVYLDAGDPATDDQKAARLIAVRQQAGRQLGENLETAPRRTEKPTRNKKQSTQIDVVGEEGGEARVRELDETADQLLTLQAEQLGPAVDSLRAYLVRRVEPDHQQFYIETVIRRCRSLEWITGDGTALPPEERMQFLADVLVALLGMKEDEGYGRPVGDPDNLFTKLGWNLGERNKVRPVPGVPTHTSQGSSMSMKTETAEEREKRLKAEAQAEKEEREAAEAELLAWEKANPERARALSEECVRTWERDHNNGKQLNPQITADRLTLSTIHYGLYRPRALREARTLRAAG